MYRRAPSASEQRNVGPRVVAGDRHHETEVRLDQLTLCLLVASVLAARQLALLLGSQEPSVADLTHVELQWVRGLRGGGLVARFSLYRIRFDAVGRHKLEARVVGPVFGDGCTLGDGALPHTCVIGRLEAPGMPRSSDRQAGIQPDVTNSRK
jgi:hypothetical protein